MQDAARKIQKLARGMLDRKRAADLSKERHRRRRFQEVMLRNEERAKVAAHLGFAERDREEGRNEGKGAFSLPHAAF